MQDNAGCITKMVLHPNFEKVIGVVIFVNVAFMGASADYAITNVEEPDLPGTVVIDITFCTLYTLELAVKLYVFKKRFFVGPDRYWNYFDALLVIQNIYEQFALLSVSSSGGSFAFLRSMRLLKMVV